MDLIRLIKLALAFIPLIIIQGCDKAEEVMPDIDFLTTQDEIELGYEIDKQILKEAAINGPGSVLDTFGYQNTYGFLKNIQTSLLQTEKFNNTNVFPWTIRIFHNDTILNAFCLPGGYIYLTTGILKSIDNEAQAAGLISHLMTHTDLHHTSDLMVDRFGIEFILNSLTGSGSQSINSFVNAFFLNQIIYSSEEIITDSLSVACLYKTAYDAYAVHDLFSKLMSFSNVDFLITNPSPVDRLKNLESTFLALGGVHGELFETEYALFLKSLP
jgi:hypothetical protein